MGTLLLPVLLLGLLSAASGVQAVKGVFETCPACRLSTMPELKRFLNEAVQKKEYGEDLTVKYIFGKTPTLILYDDAGKELSQTIVDPALNFEGLHKWIQGLGFTRQELIGLPPALRSSASKAASNEAGAAAATAAAAGSKLGDADPVALLPGSSDATSTAASSSSAAAAAATPAVMGPAPAPEVQQAAAAVGAALAGPVAAGPVAAGAAAGAPIPPELDVIEAQQQQELQQLQQQRRRQRRRRMRQGAAGGQQQHRRHSRQPGGSSNGPGSNAL